MALFKILRGPSSGLDKLTINDGWCYYTPDTGLFHIDYNGTRVPLNAKDAQTLSGASLVQALNREGLDKEILSAAVVKDIKENLELLISAKQEHITGTEGQVVVIGANGSPTAVNANLSTSGGIIDQNTGEIIKMWHGTVEEYDAIVEKDDNTIYILTDEVGGDIVANDIEYDNSVSGLLSTSVQNAIDEVYESISNIDHSAYSTATNLVNGDGTSSLMAISAAESSGEGSFALGNSFASGKYSMAQGFQSNAIGMYSHAEGGQSNVAETQRKTCSQSDLPGAASDIEITGTTANGRASHAEGNLTLAYGNASHAEGARTIASSRGAHSEGYNTVAYGEYSHAEGGGSRAQGNYSHAEGSGAIASGAYSHAEGEETEAIGENSHSQGAFTTAYGPNSFAGGNGTIAYNSHSFAHGNLVAAVGFGAHAEGDGANRTITISGDANSKIYTLSVVEAGIQTGCLIYYNGKCACVSAYDDNLTITLDKTLSETALSNAKALLYFSGFAYGQCSHSEGAKTKTFGVGAHAEGSQSEARGNYSHAEGYQTQATYSSAHAEGFKTIASGAYSHAEGWNITADGEAQHVQGKNNIADTTSAHIVGNGSDINRKSNAHTLDWSGNAWFAGDVYVGSTSGTNKDTGSKKLATEEFVETEVAALVGSAPETLDTIEELATALNNNKDIVTVLNDSIATKANKTDVYTKAEVDALLANYYTKAQVDAAITAAIDEAFANIVRAESTSF